MNRYITIGAGLAVIVGILAIVVWIRPSQPAQTGAGAQTGINVPASTLSTYTVTSSSSPSSVPPTSPSQSAQTAQTVLEAFNASLTGQNPDNIKPQASAAVGAWALVTWSGSYTSGQAVLHYDATQGRWVVVSSGGGVWNVAGLVKLGMPKKSALILFTALYKKQ